MAPHIACQHLPSVPVAPNNGGVGLVGHPLRQGLVRGLSELDIVLRAIAASNNARERRVDGVAKAAWVWVNVSDEAQSYTGEA